MTVLRRAAAADWPALWPIWHATVATGDTYVWDPLTDPAEARQLWLDLPAPAETWVSLAEDNVTGTYVLKPNQPGLGSHVANAAFMVAPERRGEGIGRVLAEHCLVHAAELGYLGMQFNAVVATNTGAIALWRSLGFEVVGTVPLAFRHREQGLVDIHVMYRRL